MSWWDYVYDFFWQLTHFRMQRRQHETYLEQCRQKILKARETLADLHQELEGACGVADSPNSTADDLRHASASYRRVGDNLYDLNLGSIPAEYFADDVHYFTKETNCLWQRMQDCQKAIAAHPNVSPELFGHELAINEITVAGLLRNPTLPLFFLENPSFAKELYSLSTRFDIPKNSGDFACLVLQHESIPPILLNALTSIGEPWDARKTPWIFLEVKTHMGADYPDVPGEPDLDWLDAQVIHLIRGHLVNLAPDRAWELRCLIYELVCHGLLPRELEPIAPWHAQPASSDHEAILPLMAAEYVQEWKRYRWRSVAERERILCYWVNETSYREDKCPKTRQLEAALSHPNISSWVTKSIANGWARCKRDEGNPNHGYASTKTWALHRLLTMQQGIADAAVKQRHLAEAIQDALEGEGKNPGIYYLLIRSLPDMFEGKNLHPRYQVSQKGRNHRTPRRREIELGIENQSFLVRLAIALRLNDTDPEHAEWREVLSKDPNRYVRAATRKEITWPKPTV